MNKYLDKIGLELYHDLLQTELSHLADELNDVVIGKLIDNNFYVQENIDYVEIGNIKWATRNVGANSITDTGLYFAWGDIQGYTAEQVTGSLTPHKNFAWADYKYGNGTNNQSFSSMTKYNSTDGKTVLEASDDAAVANWGGSWRMPTTDEWTALGNAVNTAWTNDYQGSGIAGLVCTDKTDSTKTLFFPAAGSCSNGSVYRVGSYGIYWSSSLYSTFATEAFIIIFNSSDVLNWHYADDRFNGFPVRGVWDGDMYLVIVPSTKKLYIDETNNNIYKYNGTSYILLNEDSGISNQEILDLFGGSSIDPSENPSIITSNDVVNTTSDGIVPKTTAAVKYLQTDSQGVASWGDKPNYNYGEISYLSDNSTDYTINNSSATLSIDGTQPMQVVTTTTNIAGITFSALPANGHSCHLIITAASDLTVDIAHNATMITVDSTAYTTVCPKAAAIDTLEITAGGYVELDLLRVGTKIYVRGV